MHNKNTIIVPHYRDAATFAAEGRVALPQSDEFLHEAVEILHYALAINWIQTVEEHKIASTSVPLFVLEHLLSHEEHRDAGRGEQDRIGYTGAAPRVPGTAVVRVGTGGNARMAANL